MALIPRTPTTSRRSWLALESGCSPNREDVLKCDRPAIVRDAVCRRAAESHHERQGACKIILPGKTVGLGNGVLPPWYIHPHKSCDGVPVTAWIAYRPLVPVHCRAPARGYRNRYNDPGADSKHV